MFFWNVFPLITNDLNLIMQQLTTIEGRLNKMAVDLSQLTAAVAATANVEQSAIVLIQGLAQRLSGLITANTDPQTQSSINDLVGQLNAEVNALATAVSSNPVPVANTV